MTQQSDIDVEYLITLGHTTTLETPGPTDREVTHHSEVNQTASLETPIRDLVQNLEDHLVSEQDIPRNEITLAHYEPTAVFLPENEYQVDFIEFASEIEWECKTGEAKTGHAFDIVTEDNTPSILAATATDDGHKTVSVSLEQITEVMD
jgi:hypothetical protein